jgi:hypothetical protein
MWDLWWTEWHWDRLFSEFCNVVPVSIIPLWLHLKGDKEWWPQFRDIVSHHQHEHEHGLEEDGGEEGLLDI